MQKNNSIYASYKDINTENKTILLRVDINSPIVLNRIDNSKRIIESVKTIKLFKKKRAKIVILAHQGRYGDENFTDLKQHSEIINKYTSIKYIPDIIGKKAIKAIKALKPGDAILLENLRFLDEEKHPPEDIKKNRIVMTLAPLADIYINDAFSNSHRAHTSITEFAKILPAYTGPILEEELDALLKLDKNKITHPIVYILGGAKIQEPIILLKAKKNIDCVLSCGLFAQACLLTQGFDFGAQREYLKNIGIEKNNELNQLIKLIKEHKIITPIDFAVKNNNRRVELKLSQFPSKYEIFDIGEKTITKYLSIIRGAKTIFLKGAPGDFEDENFSKGTKVLFSAIAKSNAFSFMGGGHTSGAIKKFKITGFSHVSLSGGAMLDYLAGKKLPGLEALKQSKKSSKFVKFNSLDKIKTSQYSTG